MEKSRMKKADVFFISSLLFKVGVHMEYYTFSDCQKDAFDNSKEEALIPSNIHSWQMSVDEKASAVQKAATALLQEEAPRLFLRALCTTPYERVSNPGTLGPQVEDMIYIKGNPYGHYRKDCRLQDYLELPMLQDFFGTCKEIAKQEPPGGFFSSYVFYTDPFVAKQISVLCTHIRTALLQTCGAVQIIVYANYKSHVGLYTYGAHRSLSRDMMGCLQKGFWGISLQEKFSQIINALKKRKDRRK